MSRDPGSRPDVREATRSRNVSRTVLWSYAAVVVSVALWITLVVVNRGADREAHSNGEMAGLLAVVLPVWTALGVLAVLLALIGLVRSRAKGHAVVALLLAVFVGAAPIVEQLLP